MTMNVVKLDRRYDGHDRFTHRVEFCGPYDTRVRQWIESRNWLWQQFGASAELFCARADYFNDRQPVWAWDAEKSSIYLKDEALAMFMLAFERWQK